MQHLPRPSPDPPAHARATNAHVHTAGQHNKRWFDDQQWPVGKPDNTGHQNMRRDARQVLDAVNCVVRLDEAHRFSGDREWDRVLHHMHDGLMTREDIEVLQMCVMRPGQAYTCPAGERPMVVAWANYLVTRLNRMALAAARERLTGAGPTTDSTVFVDIRARVTHMHNGRREPLRQGSRDQLEQRVPLHDRRFINFSLGLFVGCPV